MKDELNQQAYRDVLNRQEPSMPLNDEYMRHYWRWYELLPMKDPFRAFDDL